MKNERRNENNVQCRNEKNRKNLEFARELSKVEKRHKEKDCGKC